MFDPSILVFSMGRVFERRQPHRHTGVDHIGGGGLRGPWKIRCEPPTFFIRGKVFEFDRERLSALIEGTLMLVFISLFLAPGLPHRELAFFFFAPGGDRLAQTIASLHFLCVCSTSHSSFT